jgi:hypothetical protein
LSSVANMAGRARLNIGARESLALTVLLVLVMSNIAIYASVQASSVNSSGDSQSSQVRFVSLARVYPSLDYDEQVGITFTQDFTSLAFNVTAVEQTDPVAGAGPAYLLNGLTNTGLWYQVGLSYRWPGTNGQPLQGFNMAYEVFDPSYFFCPEGSVFPDGCGAGTAALNVNRGDIVQLSLNFSAGNVLMTAVDWNTTSSMTEEYAAEGASYFIGLPNSIAENGFFTGLMTEEYHASPYTGTGQPVVYRESGLNLSSGWMWLDEFNTLYGQVFANQTSAPVSYSNPTLLEYFSSNGTAEASSGQEFVTGLTPITLPTLVSSTLPPLRPGQQASLNLSIIDPAKVLVKIARLTFSSEFGTINATSSAPFTLGATSRFNSTLAVPTNVPNGNYTITMVADFEFFDTQLSTWMTAEPAQTTTLLRVTGSSVPPPSASPPPTTNPPPPTTNPTPKSNPTVAARLIAMIGEFLLPAFLVYSAAAIVIGVLLAVRRKSVMTVDRASGHAICRNCGGVITEGMLFCPSCGAALVQTLGQTSSEVKNKSGGMPAD